ncbi:nuclear transport factor 2 family protein [Mycolicibacterium palauense]|uniref:nuclear transport factor 2 family protein n=1 Tax=Mycolicibacterium palauense TaxID=2034511 RepID=UPI000BFEFE12|nr:nuclear transport factor 2 family protein [Mycolicibacterium palauense]
MTGGDLQAWIDKQALTELVAVLSAAVDRADKQAILGCYAEPSYDDHGVFKGTGQEFAEFVCGPAAGTMVMHHLLGQSVFDVRGDEAWGETFFIFHSMFGAHCQSAFGRYIDYFRRVGPDWKVAYRRVVPDRTMAGDDMANYWAAHRGGDDPRYDRLTAPPT